MLDLHRTAVWALDGVGSAELGEWSEWTSRAFHLRRRLTPAEQLVVGPALDIRGTEEQVRRWIAVRDAAPELVRAGLLEEPL
jgi:hypothetical protein